MRDQLFSEAIKLKDGVLYNLSYHEARVKRTTEYFFGMSFPLLIEVPRDKRKGLYKCRIVYSDKISSVEFIPYSFRTVRCLSLVKNNSIDYSYKYTDRVELNALLTEGGCDDVIIIKDGFVTDASSSNLVFEDKTGLYTPNTYLLRGTKREYLIDCGIIQERIIKKEDIKKYDSVYLINAMIDIEDRIKVPVIQLGI
jgi:4-amino-4-deoxychorismate lyase